MTQPYFQFPLCLLSTVEDVRRGVNNIILFACVDIGKKRWETFSADERQALRSVLPSESVCQCSVDPTSDEQLQALVGCEYLQITTFNIKGMLARHARLSRFVKEFEEKHGIDARVRIRKDWLFEVRDNRGMSYHELAVILFSIVVAAVCTVSFAADKPNCSKTGKNCPMNDNKECNCGKSCDC